MGLDTVPPLVILSVFCIGLDGCPFTRRYLIDSLEWTRLIRDGIAIVTPTIAQTHHDHSDSGYDGASHKRDSLRRASCIAAPKKIARKW